MSTIYTIIGLMLIVSISACKSKKSASSNAESNILTTNRMPELEGKEVIVEGTYLEMNVQKRPNTEPVYVGRVYLMLADSTTVLLETQDEGYRPKEEIEMYRNQKVSVVGTYYPWCNAWGDGSQASIVGACVKDIKSLEKAR